MKSKTPHILILTITILILLTLISISSAASCNKEDKKALIAFKNSFPPKTFPNSWDIESNCCFWDGVRCDSKTGRVTSLLFTSNEFSDPDFLPVNLKGTIPPSIGSLTALESISLSDQRDLVGTLPPQMANLKNLKYFTIYNCSISGPLPSYFSKWTSLEQLEINFCSKLTGSIPASLGQLANLKSITLDDNKLTGTIPSSLFSRLKRGVEAELELDHNKLTGPVPQPFARVKWRHIDLTYNQLCGKIPSGGNYSSFNGNPFVHNKCLCGKPLPPCK